MAGMAVPGNWQEKVPGKVEQRLDLSGEWKAIFYNPECGGAVFRGEAFVVSIRDPRRAEERCMVLCSLGKPYKRRVIFLERDSD